MLFIIFFTASQISKMLLVSVSSERWHHFKHNATNFFRTERRREITLHNFKYRYVCWKSICHREGFMRKKLANCGTRWRFKELGLFLLKKENERIFKLQTNVPIVEQDFSSREKNNIRECRIIWIFSFSYSNVVWLRATKFINVVGILRLR